MSVTLDLVSRVVDGVTTIRDVSLTLERGTLSVLLGPTLSGKTSIMRLLAGLDKPTTGRVLVDGKDVTGADGWFRDGGLDHRVALVRRSVQTVGNTGKQLAALARVDVGEGYRPVRGDGEQPRKSRSFGDAGS